MKMDVNYKILIGLILIPTLFVNIAQAQEYGLLWSYKTGHIVNSVSISSDGSYIAAGSDDDKVYLLEQAFSAVAPSNVTIQVAVLVLNQDNPTKVEKGMIELLKELGFSPEVIGIDRVEGGVVKLSLYRVIVVPTYSLDIDNALKSEKVKEAIIDATNSGTNWILFNSGSKVLEVLGLATTKINSPPGWVPALPDSHYVVNATTNSPITAGVPMMPNWPGGYTLQELYTLTLDPLIWRVDNTESSRYKWLNIDEIIKEPTYLIYEGSTGWEIGKPHKDLPEWVIGSSRILYYRHFWNADPGNGGGGTVGLAGKIILKNAIEYYCNLTGPVTPVFYCNLTEPVTPVFEDDFSELNLDTWIPFGSPSPRVLPSAEGRDGVFDNNGDGWCNSGAISKENFSFSNGFTVESDMFLRVTDVTGCWNEAIIGITRQNTPTGEGVCPSESYPLGVYIGIFYTGDACWATPVEKRRHAYFRAALYAEDGTSESVGYDLSADDYINGWHNYKIVVGSDRYVKFYVDGDLIYASKKKLHPDVLNKKKIFLGVRSSGSAGKSYHDFIKVYAVEKEQHLDIDGDGVPNDSDFAPTIKNIYVYIAGAVLVTAFAGAGFVFTRNIKRRKEYQAKVREYKAKYEQLKAEGFEPDEELEELLK